MSDPVFDALRVAITISKNEKIKRTNFLKLRLQQKGFDEETINAALMFWAKHVR
jgi:hypothetical protein